APSPWPGPGGGARAERWSGAGLAAGGTASQAGVAGGGAPRATLPRAAVSVPAALAGPLRGGRPPVISRVASGRCLLDLRSVPPEQDPQLFEAVRTAADRAG